MAQIKDELAAHADPEPRRVILVLAANPLDTERLRLDAEVRAIDEQLRQGEGDDGFVLHQQWAVRSGDLIDALLRHRPAILHFAGHGAADGSLIVEESNGRATALPPDALPALRRAQRVLVGRAGGRAGAPRRLRGGYGASRRRPRRGLLSWPGRGRSSSHGGGARSCADAGRGRRR